MEPGKDINGHKTITVDSAGNGKEIEAEPGDLIQIELESKGATGFQWHLERGHMDNAELVSEGIRSPSGGKLGSPVMHYWRFKILKEGRSEIQFLYFRPWEGPSMARESYVIRLKVR